jgi:hypothetical protein
MTVNAGPAHRHFRSAQRRRLTAAVNYHFLHSFGLLAQGRLRLRCRFSPGQLIVIGDGGSIVQSPPGAG